MTPIFDSKIALEALPKPFHTIAFAASCCERLIPLYEAFYHMERWGKPQVARTVGNQLWLSAQGASVHHTEVSRLIQDLKQGIPDSEEFSSIFTTGAQEASLSLIHSLEHIVTGDWSKIALVSRAATNAVFDYLSTVNDPETEVHAIEDRLLDYVSQAPLMVAELEKQQNDIEALKLHVVLSPEFLAELRASSVRMGINPFQRGLVRIFSNIDM